MKILICFGTRPEAIKMAPVIKALKKKHKVVICVTAQHREMLDQVLEFFEIVPDHDLDLMKPDQSLNLLGSSILMKIDVVFQQEKPELVLVQGDTTTAVVASLAAFHRGIKVGHIEAGLRTYNKTSPFPEEVNRQLTARIADLHFAPTIVAKENLLNENISSSQIYITGNTVVDALEWAKEKILRLPLNDESTAIKGLLNPLKHIILVTGHRRENFGEGLNNICTALIRLANNPDFQIIFPVHLNPNVKNLVSEKLGHIDNIHLINPVLYSTMLWLMKQAAIVISDSGGIQEEAPSFSIPVVVTREVTERMEGVTAGCAFLTGTDPELIVSTATRLLDNQYQRIKMDNPYGDGKASERIAEIIDDL